MSKSERIWDTAVIGGGAAGLMAAVTAAENGLSVLLIERNGITGKKLLITGKGRCNVTNNSDNDNIMKNTPTNSRFLYSALSGFSAYDTMDFFESCGVPLKTERGNRVFPISDKASDIAQALRRRADNAGVKTIQAIARRIITDGGRATGVACDGGEFYAKSVILATGGASYPATGSKGDGYKMAKELGHTIIPPKPMLVPMTIKERVCGELMGLSLKNVALTIKSAETSKVLYKEQGEMLFTHFGISGPIVLSASAFVKGACIAEIDFKPALTEQKLDARILREFEAARNKQISTVMKTLLPERMIEPIIDMAGISPDTKINVITKAQRQGLVAALKAYPLTVTGLRPIEEAIITDGGISVKEINPATMESKIVQGLYFAGEIIDVAAYTGGYNLQIAFATGRLAGGSVADNYA